MILEQEKQEIQNDIDLIKDSGIKEISRTIDIIKSKLASHAEEDNTFENIKDDMEFLLIKICRNDKDLKRSQETLKTLNLFKI